jgi:pyrroloquinoline quinone (PQQ) biosynthesis protein C
MFDPFCRWKKIKFMGMDTTVGQLNFFNWVIEDEVLDYLETHLEAVQADMDSCSTVIRPTEEGRRKRHELSRSATKSVCHASLPVLVKFD